MTVIESKKININTGLIIVLIGLCYTILNKHYTYGLILLSLLFLNSNPLINYSTSIEKKKDDEEKKNDEKKKDEYQQSLLDLASDISSLKNCFDSFESRLSKIEKKDI